MFNVNCKLCKTFITEESQNPTGNKQIISVAQMVGTNTFSYGISGIYYFKKDLGLKEGDSVCNACLKKHKDEIKPFESIRCDICGVYYQATFSEVNQGFECSAWAKTVDGQLLITCGWGSHYDTSQFKVIIPVIKEGEQLCDKCINLFLEEGSIENLHHS